MKTKEVFSKTRIEERIFSIRGHKVILDIDLAVLYHVPVKRLKEQVRRNKNRFPDDFLFHLTIEETTALLSSRSQIASLNWGANVKYGSFAFTEEGVSMLSGVLHSPRAVEVNIAIMRAFVCMRHILSENIEFAKKLEELENKLIHHDNQIYDVVKAIRRLMSESRKQKPKIGYLV